MTRTTSYSLIEIPISSLKGSTNLDLTAITQIMISATGTQHGTGTFFVDNVYFGGSVATVPVSGVTVSPMTATINGEMLKLKATVFPGNATNKSVIWSSDNSSVASVNVFGQVMGNSVGDANISVTTEDSNFSATAAIHVTAPTQGRALKVMPLGDSITEGYTIPGGYRLKL